MKPILLASVCICIAVTSLAATATTATAAGDHVPAPQCRTC
jgi:hypothetical protein